MKYSMQHAPKLLIVLAFGFAPLITSTAMAKPLSYELPDETAEFKLGPGMEAAQSNCAACHSADYVITQPPKMGKTFWNAEVEKMIKTYHAPIEESEKAAIIDYLATTY